MISYIGMYFVILRPQVSIVSISIFGLAVLFRWDHLFLLPNLPIYQNITNKTDWIICTYGKTVGQDSTYEHPFNCSYTDTVCTEAAERLTCSTRLPSTSIRTGNPHG